MWRAEAEGLEDVFVDASATFGDGALGLVIGSSSTGGALVTRVVEGGAAEQHGVVEGSLIVAVNGEDVTTCDKDTALAIVQTTPRPMTIALKVPAHLAHPASGAGKQPVHVGGGPSSSSLAPTAAPAAACGGGSSGGSSGGGGGSSGGPPSSGISGGGGGGGGSAGHGLGGHGQREIWATFGDGPLDLVLENLPSGGTAVKCAIAGGAAAAQGVVVGSRVVALDNEDVSGCDEATLSARIVCAPRPLTLTLLLPDGLSSARVSSVRSEEEEEDFEAMRERLRELRAAPDVPTEMASEATPDVSEAVPPAAPPASPPAAPPGASAPTVVQSASARDARVVNVTMGPGLLGLHLATSDAGDTVVRRVAEGSLAAEQPIPEGGVLQVNGESVRGVDHRTVSAIVGSAPRPLTLQIGLPDL